MRIALIADVFPPLRSSGAVQLRDLSRELLRQGHIPTVLVPCSEMSEAWRLDRIDGVQVLRLKAAKAKDLGYVRRTINELLMPFWMRRSLAKSPFAQQRWDAVIWYSPTIFLGPLANFLKKKSRCPSYLIIRDIFPEWAVDMGLLKRGLVYAFFKQIEVYQYSVADTIGVQTRANLAYFDKLQLPSSKKIEVLENWLGTSIEQACSIRLQQTSLAGRFIFVYAGNMGVAQGMQVFIELATQLQERTEIGFVFVGRGSDYARLAAEVRQRELNNVLFFDEIDPDEIAGLYAQCNVGIVSLDVRHKTHNIPGKFLSYMQNGLPVLAKINPGNDLEKMIVDEAVGEVSTNDSVVDLKLLAEKLVLENQHDVQHYDELKQRCYSLFQKHFSAQAAVAQLIQTLER